MECLAQAEEDFRELDTDSGSNIFLTKTEFGAFWNNQQCNDMPLDTIFADFDYNTDSKLDVDEIS